MPPKVELNSWVLPITLPGEIRMPLERMRNKTGASFSAYINIALEKKLEEDGYFKKGQARALARLRGRDS